MTSMPQSEPTLQELCQQLANANPSDGQEVAPRLHRYFLEDPARWEEISDTVVELLMSVLDASGPVSRSAALFVLGHVGAHGGEYCEFNGQTHTRSEIVERMLDSFDNESRTVRQTAANPFYMKDIAEGVLDDTIDVSSEQLAVTLFDAFRDPEPIVRLRSGKVLMLNRTDLIAVHPKPDDAATTLTDALEDPVDGLSFYNIPVMSPRWVALSTLQDGLNHYDTEVITANTTAITRLLEDNDRSVRESAASLLAELNDQDILDIEQFDDDIVTAIQNG